MAHFMSMVLDGLHKWPSSPLIRPFTGTPTEFSWGLITFEQFRFDLEKTAEYWQETLAAAGLQVGDVVGLWLTGEHVTDLVHLYGLSRAGYVPELFSLKFSLPGQDVVRDLLKECHGKALLYDTHFASLVTSLALPKFPLVDVSSLPPATRALKPLPGVSAEDTAIIFHTSGTTGGRPKPVPQTHKWCKAHSMVCWKGVWQGTFDTPDVVNNIGSFAHMGASTYIYKSAFSGGSFIQTSRPDIGADEFLAMVRQCGLNRLLQYATWLSALIGVARTNGEVLEALRGLRQVVYTGLSMNPEDEKWALANGVPITNLYGTTETAQCLISDLPSTSTSTSTSTHLRPIPSLGLQLIPALNSNGASSSSSTSPLYDLFLPLSALNCPHPSVRNRPDGHVTGDLFEEVKEGCYVFRGRSDDWIKTGPTRAAFCDTKAIEDNVLKTCADLVQNCIAVGHLKPRVVLLVEPRTDTDEHRDPPVRERVAALAPVAQDTRRRLKEEILQRTAEYNSRLLDHERISDSECVLVVPAGSLPRTSEKGNIRRKAAHEQFAHELSALWGE